MPWLFFLADYNNFQVMKGKAVGKGNSTTIVTGTETNGARLWVVTPLSKRG